MSQTVRPTPCQLHGNGPSTTHQQYLPVALLQLPCRSRAGSRGRITASGFRGAKLLGPLLAPEQQPQQQQQPAQQQQQLQAGDTSVPNPLSFLPWVGSTEKQHATEPTQEQQQQQEEPSKQDTAAPSDYMALLFVSLLWGSYAPALRYLYNIDGLLTPQVLTAHRTVISAAALVIASLGTYAIDRYQQHKRLQQQLREEQLQREREEQLRKQWLRLLPALLLNMLAPFGSSSTTTSSRGHSSKQPLFPLLFRPNSSSSGDGVGRSLLKLLPRLPGTSSDQASSRSSGDSSSASGATATASSSSSSSAAPFSAVLLAGLELGTWNFLATAAQACGLNLSTATKAAFLTQTTAVFTPCLAMLCGQAVLPAHWVACLAALLGSVCITMDSMEGPDSSSSTAVLVSSTERQQQELVVTVRPAAEAAPGGVVGEVLEAPPVLATALDAAAAGGSSSGVEQGTEATPAAFAAYADAGADAGAYSSGAISGSTSSSQHPVAAESATAGVAQAGFPGVYAAGAQAEVQARPGVLPSSSAADVAASSSEQQEQEQEQQQLALKWPGQAADTATAEGPQAQQLQQQDGVDVATSTAAGHQPACLQAGDSAPECSVGAINFNGAQQQQEQLAFSAADATDAAATGDKVLDQPATSSSSEEGLPGVQQLAEGQAGLQGSEAQVAQEAAADGSADMREGTQQQLQQQQLGEAAVQGQLQAFQRDNQQRENQQVENILVQQQQQIVQEMQLSTASTAASTVAPSSSSSWELTGEVYILLACCCYAIATVRLSMLAPGLDPVQLATSKTLTLAAASLFWLLAFGTGAEVVAEAAGDAEAVAAAGESVSVAAAGAGTAGAAALVGGMLDQASAAMQAAWASWQLPPAFDHGQGKLLLFYSALGPGALATVLQTKGQGTVAAAQAQVFYSLTPVWAALLAKTCLQGEEMGPLAWLGGCIIIAASIGAAISGSSSSSGASGSDNGTER